MKFVKEAVGNIRRRSLGVEVVPKGRIFSIGGSKQGMYLGLNRKEDTYLVILEIANNGPLKVKTLDAHFTLSSTRVLLEPIEESLKRIASNSIAKTKLPFFSRIWISLREGIMDSYHLFELNDDNSERDVTEIYFYRNRSREERVRIFRIEGSGDLRTLQTKTISLDAYRALCDGLSKLLAAEQTDKDQLAHGPGVA